MIKLSDYVMRFLVSKGVREVFMLPGGGAMHLNDSLGRCRELNYTCFIHEQALGIAAEAWGQHTNTPGVALVTSGPGSTNTVTAVAAGYIDSTPAFFISGQAKRADLKTGTGCRQVGSQEVDIVSIVSSITKYAVTVLEPNEIRYHLEKAWHEATTGRMGPVWIDIPLDVQGTMIDEQHLQGFEPQTEPPAPLCGLDEVIAALSASKRPLILAGNGVKMAGAQNLLLDFARRNRIPMVLTWKTIDLLGYDDPLNFGCPGIMGTRFANFIVQNCDLLLIIGSRLEPSVTAFNSADFARNARKVMADIDPCEIRKVKGIDIGIAADAAEFLEHLRAVDMPSHDEWLAYCSRVKERYPVVLPEYYEHPQEKVNLYVFTDELFKQLQSKDVIVPESSGAAGEVTYQAMRIKPGQKVRNAAGLGSMGFGLPYAIGACLANGRRRTVLINGDGAFQMNIQELETVIRLKLPVKMFIWDNNGYGSIMNTQRNMFEGFYVGSEPGSGLTLPDVTRQAAAYGIRSERITCNADLEAGIARTLAGDDPVICRVEVTPDHLTMPKVQAMRLPDGGMVSKPLEDMWPYLSAEEIAENMIADDRR